MQQARILQVALEPPGDAAAGDPLEANEESFLAALRAADRFDPDFVVAQELALAGGIDRADVDVAALAHRFPGSFTDRVAARARDLDSYVWIPTYQREDGDVYNAAGLISPAGEYLGAYRKAAPTVDEIENRGVTPGDSLPVWDTEFGRVGATICWDVRFDELAFGYRAKDIDIMFHPTHGVGHGKLANWATYHGFHVAYCWERDLKVYTPHGRVCGRQTDHPTLPSEGFTGADGSARFALTTVNTDLATYARGEFDYDDTELNDVLARYPDAVEIHELSEQGVIVVESTEESLSINDLTAEFDLPTTEFVESRTRELVSERIGDSPLLEPDRFPSA